MCFTILFSVGVSYIEFVLEKDCLLLLLGRSKIIPRIGNAHLVMSYKCGSHLACVETIAQNILAGHLQHGGFFDNEFDYT